MFTWRSALVIVVLAVLLFGVGYGGMRFAYQGGFRLWSLTGDESLEETNLHDSSYIFLSNTYSTRRAWPPGPISIFAGPQEDQRVVGRVVVLEPMHQKWSQLRRVDAEFFAEEIRGHERIVNELKSSEKYVLRTTNENHPIFDLHQEYMYICKVARNYAQINYVRLLVIDTVNGDAKVKSGLRLEVFPAWKSDTIEWSTIEMTPGVKIQGVVPFEMAFVHRLVVLDSKQ